MLRNCVAACIEGLTLDVLNSPLWVILTSESVSIFDINMSISSLARFKCCYSLFNLSNNLCTLSYDVVVMLTLWHTVWRHWNWLISLSLFYGNSLRSIPSRCQTWKAWLFMWNLFPIITICNFRLVRFSTSFLPLFHNYYRIIGSWYIQQEETAHWSNAYKR